MRKIVLLLASAVLAVLLVSGVALVTMGERAEAAYPGKNGKIAFEKHAVDDPEQSGIYTVDPDGTNLIDVGDSRHWETRPSFSPDGTRIAFTRAVDEWDFRDLDLWVMDADGSDQRILSEVPDGGAFFNPTWSPDGKHVAYEYTMFSETSLGLIYVTAADGSGTPRNLGVADAHKPVWSPSGEKIAFEKQSTDGSEVNGIYTMNPDGSEETLLIPGGHDPEWSPDGEKIAFAGWHPPSERGIYVMNSDGSGEPEFVVAGGSDPAFSPDGTKIAFEDNNDSGRSAIYTINVDGTDKTFVTNGSRHADWQPLPFTPPPDTSITGGPSGFVSSTTAKLNFSASREDSTFECSLDGSAFEDCTSPKTYTGLRDGKHTFRVKASAPAGNVDPSHASRSWRVDTAAPLITKVRPVSSSTIKKRAPTISATIRDAQLNLAKKHIKLFVNGKQRRTFEYDRDTDRLYYTPASRLPLGKHTVRIKARDAVSLTASKKWNFKLAKRRFP